MQSFLRKRWFISVAALVLAIVPTMAHAAIVVYNVNMNGANESPANASLGTGLGQITFDTTTPTMTINVTFNGLSGTTTNAHIHAATAVPFAGNSGVATQTPTFSGFPAGVNSGTYVNSFDMTLASSYSAAYITANGGTTASAFNALLTAAADGKAYFNIHTTVFTGGEIRGFLTAVPEPSSMCLLGVAGVGFVFVQYRKRAKKAAE